MYTLKKHIVLETIKLIDSNIKEERKQFKLEYAEKILTIMKTHKGYNWFQRGWFDVEKIKTIPPIETVLANIDELGAKYDYWYHPKLMDYKIHRQKDLIRNIEITKLCNIDEEDFITLYRDDAVYIQKYVEMYNN